MALNTSFSYGFNVESFVADLLADESFEDDGDCSNPFPTEILDNAPAAVVCCHERKKLFCTSCLTENCEFCVENFHVNHSTISRKQASSKAQFVRNCLVLEANNFIFELDIARKIIQDRIDTLLSNALDACVGISAYVKSSSNVSTTQEEELYAQVMASKNSKEIILRQQLIFLKKIRKTAIQIPNVLNNQLVLTVAAQLIANDMGLTDLAHCRSEMKNLYEEMSMTDTTTCMNKLCEDAADSKAKNLENDFQNLKYLPKDICLIGLPRSPLEEIFSNLPKAMREMH